MKLIFLLIGLAAAPPLKAGQQIPATQKNPAAIRVLPGFSNGQPNQHWRQALQSRLPHNTIDSLCSIRRPLTKEETAWYNLVTAKTTRWNTFRDSLAIPFSQLTLPDTINILLGFTGQDDGFTFEDRTVCLDLTALQKAYGDTKQPGNQEKIDRIFAHEYTHLLHKAWARNANWQPLDFKDSLLWECLYEGMGMYRSLSQTWKPVQGILPVTTINTLDELYPVFTNNLIKLSCKSNLSPEEKQQLTRNLSRGRVPQKWGAFTVGIWMLLAADKNDRNLIPILQQGPMAVIQLAEKYLPQNYWEQWQSACEK